MFVLWSDMKIIPSTFSTKTLRTVDGSHVLCTVPILRNPHQEIIPSIQVPAFIRKRLKVLPWSPIKNGLSSIFPFDYCGLYNRELFLAAGGYDYMIVSPYWQKLDFGFRAFMWNEKIVCSDTLVLDYSFEVPSEDNTPNESYKFFYLKNIAIRYRHDMAILPRARILTYLIHTDRGPIQSFREFWIVKKWVELNKFRFKRDAQGLVALWEMPE